MSDLFQKRDVWYYRYTFNGHRRSKSLKTKDKQSAKRIQKLWDAKLEQRTLGLTPTRLKLSSLLEDFLERKRATLKPGSFVRYSEMVASLLAGSPVDYVQKLRSDDISDYIQTRRKQGRANKTIHEEIAILKAAMTTAQKEGRLGDLPIKMWPTLKRAAHKAETVGHYSSDEVAALKAHLQGREFERCFLFAVYTGCRRSELHGVRWRDVDLSARVIRIRNLKTESTGHDQFRTISIHPELISVLGKPGKMTDPLFPELLKHSRNWPAIQMREACNQISIQYRRFHGLRHTAATYLLAAGVPLRDVMQLMGWNRLETAQRYIHLANAAAGQINKLPY